MKKIPKTLKAVPKRPTSASRMPEMLALIGIAFDKYAVGHDTLNARRLRSRVREASAVGQIVREQAKIRSEISINKPPEERDSNYGYAFSWTDRDRKSPSHRLIARASDGGQKWRNVAAKRGYVAVPRPIVGELGPLTPLPSTDKDGAEYLKIDCVEVRLLHHINHTLPLEAASRVLLYSERAPCASCCVVIQKFLNERKAASLSVVFGHGEPWSEEAGIDRRHALSVRNQMERKFSGRLAFRAVEELHRQTRED